MPPAGHMKALGRIAARRGGTCWHASRIGKTLPGWFPFLVLSSVRAIPFYFRKFPLLRSERHVAWVRIDCLTPRACCLRRKGVWATPLWGTALFAALTEPALRFRPMRVTILSRLRARCGKQSPTDPRTGRMAGWRPETDTAPGGVVGGITRTSDCAGRAYRLKDDRSPEFSAIARKGAARKSAPPLAVGRVSRSLTRSKTCPANLRHRNEGDKP
jgi:hypothetical protein